MSWITLLGYAASAAVLATFCMSTMIPLRVIALGSNVLFALYGYFDHLYPVLILHAILFPVNLFRLMQFQRLIRDVRQAQGTDLPVQSMFPYMTQREVPAGETLIRKGEKADRLFYLLEGELEIVDLGKRLEPGAVLGEIGVFASAHERTATIVCRTKCLVLEMTESTAQQLFFQDRSFGFAVMKLIINRLLENNRRLLQSAASSPTG